MSQTAANPATRDPLIRILAWSIFTTMLAFLLNVYLTLWQEWPGATGLLEHLTRGDDERKALAGGALTLGWIQLLLYRACWGGGAAGALGPGSRRTLLADSDTLSAIAAWIVRAAFWSVMLVGLADMVISFLRVEGFLTGFLSDETITDLGRPAYRSVTVHYPLIVLSMVVATFTRTIGFPWLALLVVIAEFQIVLARFIFSYEQAFMGDLVRFWYASLFLFASAYTLIHEGHVRVDVVYAHFSERGKAWANAFGSLFLGIPICWIILSRGMGGKSSVITSPLLSHEISQSGFGMYVKYLMAGFLLIYAVSMMAQFASYFLRSAAVLRGEEVPNTNVSTAH